MYLEEYFRDGENTVYGLTTDWAPMTGYYTTISLNETISGTGAYEVRYRADIHSDSKVWLVTRNADYEIGETKILT